MKMKTDLEDQLADTEGVFLPSVDLVVGSKTGGEERKGSDRVREERGGGVKLTTLLPGILPRRRYTIERRSPF